MFSVHYIITWRVLLPQFLLSYNSDSYCTSTAVFSKRVTKYCCASTIAIRIITQKKLRQQNCPSDNIEQKTWLNRILDSYQIYHYMLL